MNITGTAREFLALIERQPPNVIRAVRDGLRDFDILETWEDTNNHWPAERRRTRVKLSTGRPEVIIQITADTTHHEEGFTELNAWKWSVKDGPSGRVEVKDRFAYPGNDESYPFRAEAERQATAAAMTLGYRA